MSGGEEPGGRLGGRRKWNAGVGVWGRQAPDGGRWKVGSWGPRWEQPEEGTVGEAAVWEGGREGEGPKVGPRGGEGREGEEMEPRPLEGLREMALGAREERRARGAPGGGAGGYFCRMGKW